MTRLGVILMVVGGLMFLSFFVAVASGGRASGDADHHTAAGARVEQRASSASAAFGVSAVGMLLTIVGATLVAVGRGQTGSPGDDGGRLLGRRRRVDGSGHNEDGPMVLCTTCGARRLARATMCGNCGSPC